jgi:uncharacterized membrane protein YsdA (DUF1294 family)
MDTDLAFFGTPIFFVFSGINLVAFLLMLWDKAQSRKNGAERISEGLLFFMATMFGAIGVYLGMLTFRHKTRKWYFLIGIPMLMLENIALLVLIADWL